MMEGTREREIVAMVERLVAARTVSYDPEIQNGPPPDDMPAPGEEHRVTEILEELLDRVGIQTAVFGDERRPTLVARVGCGREGFRRLLWAVHTDTRPSGDGAWKLTPDPFRLWHRGNLLAGRGVAGAKGPLAAAVSALRSLASAGEEIPGLVILLAHAAGACGGAPGVRKFVERGALGATDALILGTGRGLQRLVVAEKGMVLLEVRLRGRAAAGGTPRLGRSAIGAAAALIHELRENPLWSPANPLFPSGVTANASQIRSSGPPNLVADRCVLTMDLRFPPPLESEAVLEDFGRVLQRICRDAGVEPEVSVRARLEPHRVPLDRPLIRWVRDEVDAEPVGTGTRSVAGLLASAGITAAGLSPGGRENFHGPDESVNLSELLELAELLERIARRVAAQPV